MTDPVVKTEKYFLVICPSLGSTFHNYLFGQGYIGDEDSLVDYRLSTS